MKTKLLKILVTFSLGLILSAFTIWGLVGCEPVCGTGELAGNDGSCYSCPGGGSPSHSGGSGCSSGAAGVYCCAGGGGGGGTGCNNGCSGSTPWRGGNKCFSSADACHAGGYSSCSKCN